MRVGSLQKFKMGALVFSVPLIQFFFLRIFLHSVLRLKIGWGSLLVDADLLIPLTAAFFLYFFSLTEKNIYSPLLQRKTVALNSLLFLTFLTMNFFYSDFSKALGLSFQILWWAWAVAVLSSAFFLFYPVAFFFKRQHAFSLLLCGLMALSIVIGKHQLEALWQPILAWFRATACPLANAVISETAACRIATSSQGVSVLRMESPSLLSFIGKPCSGLDGALFFINLSILVWFKFKDRISVGSWVAMVGAGLGFTFVINTLRIAFLFVSAFWLQTYFSRQGVHVFQWLFHTHAGWLFNLLFAVVYYSLLLPKEDSITSTKRPDLPFPKRNTRDLPSWLGFHSTSEQNLW